MIYDRTMFPTKKWEKNRKDGFALLEAAGFVKTISPGCTALLPLGTALLHKISHCIRQACQAVGFYEVALPLLQKYNLWEESGRASKYPGLLCETMIGDRRFVINPTQEEAVLDLFRKSGIFLKDLPLQVFHMGERVRNEIRPSHGLIRSRTFTLLDLYGITPDARTCAEVAEKLHEAMELITKWACLNVRRGQYYPSINEVPTYSYWIPSVTKQCTVTVCNNCNASFRTRKILAECPSCQQKNLDLVEGVEIGDVMQNGDMISSHMGITPANSDVPVHVAMMGLGVSRLMQLIAEYHHDHKGLVLPRHIAPFDVHIVTSEGRSQEASRLYEVLVRDGGTSFLDLRKNSLKSRLVDADMMGSPFRVVFAKKTMEGKFEVTNRKTGKSRVLDIKGFLARLQE